MIPRDRRLQRAAMYGDAIATVGGTPLVQLTRIASGLPGRVLAKLEMRNPGGSVKDRLALALLDEAEGSGRLQRGATVIEATGGNTGIGLAVACAIRGYGLMLTMPSAMSAERVALLRHLGAQVVLTPGILMAAAVARADQLAEEVAGSVRLNQFGSPANAEIHRRTTAIEVWEDSGGAVDVFVAGVGTGGTITGVGEVLKERNPHVRVVAVEPAGAAVLSGGPVSTHQMPGIGVGFIPDVLNRSIIDEVIVVTDDEAFAAARRLARVEGILAGVSSGAALHAALAIAAEEAALGTTTVVLLADGGERYLSSALFLR
jgi:cysteine synthase A